MKIAFLCLNLVDSIRRAEAFIKNFPNDDFTIAIVREEHDRYSKHPRNYTIPLTNVSYIEGEEFNADDYDLVLPNNDKACGFLFSHVYKDRVPNLSSKVLFQKTLLAFKKFDLLRTNVPEEDSSFSDDDFVMMKPANSSGGHSELNLCYNKRKFIEVAEYARDSNFLIQEYRDSHDILLLSFVSNGVDIVLYDVVEQEFRPSKRLNIFTSYVKSNLYLRDQHSELIQKTKEFFNFSGMQEFRGFFGVQFLVHDGKYFPVDCNLRTGPLAMEIEFRNLLDTRMYKSLPFFFGSEECKEYLENPKNYEAYLCYAEEEGRVLTSRKVIPNYQKRISITSAKTSGTFRKDYEMFIERVE